MPEFILVGGPNGSGKSTFIREFLESRPISYLCADEVAFELNRENPESVAAQAGRIFLTRIREACKKGEDVIVESTLSGKSFRKTVELYKEAGYTIRVVFVTPLDVDENVRRVASRSAKGGHMVPEPDIRRRFIRAHLNFWEIYRSLADRWKLYGNEDVIRKIAEGRNQKFLVNNPEVFDHFMKILYHN